MSIESIANNFAKEWSEIDNLMQKPALTSAETALNKLDKTINKKGTDEDRLRSIIYHFAIDYGCEFSLFDNERGHYANNDNREEGSQILLESYVKARDLMLTMSNRVDKVIALEYMNSLLKKYINTTWNNNDKISFNSSEENIPADKLGIWKDMFQNDELKEYTALRYLGSKKLSELPTENIKQLQRGIGRELESYIKSGAEDELSNYAYLIKNEGDRKAYSLVRDVVMHSVLLNDWHDYTQDNTYQPSLFWPWNQNMELIIDRDKTDFIILSLYDQIKIHLSRKELKAVAHYFLVYGDMVYSSKTGNLSKEYIDSYSKACENMIELLGKDESAIIVADKLSTLMLNEYNTKCLPEEMDPALPQKIIDFCDKYIKLFPKAKGIDNLKATKETVLRHRFEVKIDKKIISSKDSLVINLSYSNTEAIEVELLKCIFKNKERIVDMDMDNSAVQKKPVKLKQSVFNLDKTNYYIKKNVSINIADSLEYGAYILKVKDAAEKNAYQTQIISFFVSDIVTFTFAKDLNRQVIYCVDRETGHPVEGVNIDLVKMTYASGIKITDNIATTDKNGRAEVNQEYNYIYQFYAHKDNDINSPLCRIAYSYKESKTKRRTITSANTDRSIYRPGQTVHINVLAYISDDTLNKVEPNKVLNVEIVNSEGNSVYKGKVTTNSFGTANFDYAIPTGKLNGQYRIWVNGDCIASFSVEEYVRPKFMARIDSYEGTIAIGNEITVNGIAQLYSGEPLVNADVRIDIKKNHFYDWSRPFYVSDPYQKFLFAKTDSNGRFSVKFTPERDKCATDTTWISNAYSINGHVTSESGETQDFTDQLIVNSEDLILNLHLENYKYEINDKFNLEVNSTSSQGKDKSSDVTIVLKNLHTEETKELCKRKVTGKETLSFDLHSFGIGEWEIKVLNETLNKYDKKPDAKQFTIFDKNSSVCPVKKSLWISTSSEIELEKNEDLNFCIASQEKDAKVLVCHRINKKPSLEKWIDLNNSQTGVTFKYGDLFTNEYENEASTIKFILIKNNNIYEKKLSIKKKPKKYSYPITLKTYRDKITPGSKEKWTIDFKVPDSETNKLKEAEILALMYDASLDMFANHRIKTFDFYRHYITIWYWNLENNYGEGQYYESELKYNSYCLTPNAPSWLWENAIHSLPKEYSRSIRIRGASSIARATMRSKSVGMGNTIVVAYEEEPMPTADMAMAAPLNAKVQTDGTIDNNESGHIDKTPSSAIFKIRENFNETAFFYPSVLTNDNGEATIEFEVPESLTEWKFMAFAHTKDLDYGTMEKKIEASQPLSIRANLPRFFRRGDKQSIKATVARIDENVKSAKVYVKITDAQTEKTIFEDSKAINLNEIQTIVNFMYDIPETLSAAIVEFMVEANGFTDGERHKLPVINNCEHIVKSVNMIVKEGSEKTFELPKADKDAKNKELTVQYTANAAWSVVTALPSAKEYTNNAISLANALYVNALSGDIAQKYPEIKEQVEKWSKSTDSRHLKSPLENDENLKSVLLEETPWVNEAERESMWKNELVSTLDYERAKKECDKIINSLKNFQGDDGGFSWFENSKYLPSSYYTTLVVCETLTKMHQRKLLYSTPGAKDMLAKALIFTDKKTLEIYERLKKEKYKYISEYELHNMMVRMNTTDIVEIDGKVKDIYKEYLNHINKNWVDLSLYGKATLAILDFKSGDKATAKKIIEAIREGYTKSETEGIYWKSNQDYSRIYSSAILRQALCIRAFALIDPRPEEIEMMKQWLIVRKSRTMWESDIATIDAIDAVLFESKNITSENITSTLSFGDITLTASTSKGNEGFIQYTSKESDMPASIHVKQADNAVGIGAAYISYDSKLENITSNASGISIEKETYLVVPSKDNSSMVLKELKAGEELTVGDKVKVVLKIHNDQDLDFVTLKDRRPACFEPTMVMSGYKMTTGGNNDMYYQVLKDASMCYMFDRLSKGTHLFAYESSVTHEGKYQTGTATIQSTYNPSYNANSITEAIKVKSK